MDYRKLYALLRQLNGILVAFLEGSSTQITVGSQTVLNLATMKSPLGVA